MKIGVIFPILAIFVSCLYVSFAVADNNVMTVEANIFGTNSNVSIVSIQVPDYIFLGNLTKGIRSDEIKVTVNNTGTADVSVTPKLVDSSEKIFNFTYFRLTKTSNNTAVPFTKIGDFNFNITKSNHKYFYMSLDLTNYPDDIPQDLIGHQTDIKFIAMAQ